MPLNRMERVFFKTQNQKIQDFYLKIIEKMLQDRKNPFGELNNIQRRVLSRILDNRKPEYLNLRKF